jgi:hypothetical protein
VTHQLGWELRLEIAGSMQLSQVCRTMKSSTPPNHGELRWWGKAGSKRPC